MCVCHAVSGILFCEVDFVRVHYPFREVVELAYEVLGYPFSSSADGNEKENAKHSSHDNAEILFHFFLQMKFNKVLSVSDMLIIYNYFTKKSREFYLNITGIFYKVNKKPPV